MSPAEPLSPGPPARTDADRPEWFRAFLADRSTRKPSPHTVDAYRRDFDAIAAVLAGGPEHLAALEPAAITKDAMRQAFAIFAASREAASIRRCWSTWNTLCSYLFTAELLGANPMQFVGRPKVAKNLPKSLPAAAARALVDAVGDQSDAKLRNEWPERDRAIILTTLLSGLRAGELRAANIGDVRLTEHGGVIHVRGKGNKDRAIPIEATLIDVLSDYLASRGTRFPATSSVARPATFRFCAGGPPERRCLSVSMDSESPAGHCNTGSCARSDWPARTPTAIPAPSCTPCDTPTPLNWPTPTSAFTA